MNPFSRGIRNAFRNSIRTASIVLILGLSIGLSLVMLIANKAVESKIATVKNSIGNTISISAAGTMGFQGGGDPLSESAVDKILSITDVTSITKNISDQLRNVSTTNREGETSDANTSLISAIDLGSLGRRFNNIQNDIPPLSTPGGREPSVSAYGSTDVTKVNGTTISLNSGNLINGSEDKDVALIGKTLAAKNNLIVGSTFTAYGSTITVAGIYDTGTTFGNNSLLLSLPTLQRLSGQTNDITNATIYVDSVSNVDNVTTAIKTALGTTADVVSSKDSVASAIEPLNSVKSIATFSLIGAVVVGGVIILLTMVIVVRERKKEIGVVKAIGGSNIKIVSEFMFESLTLAALGAIIGLIIGIAGAQPVTKLLVTNSTSSTPALRQGTDARNFTTSNISQRPQLSTGGFSGRVTNNQAIKGINTIKTQVGISIVAYGIGVALLIATLGSGLAAVMIAKVRPSTIMRAE